MEYHVTEKKDYSIVKVMGRFNRNAVYSVRQFVMPLLVRNRFGIALDMKDVTEEMDPIFQVGLLNAFRRELDFAGANLKVSSLNNGLREYFARNRMDEFFEVYDNLDSAVNSFENDSKRKLQ